MWVGMGSGDEAAKGIPNAKGQMPNERDEKTERRIEEERVVRVLASSSVH
jgi:hypothetical protein